MTELKKIIWIYAPWKGNFWFIDVEDQKKGYFCFGFNNMNAMPGDKVEAKIKITKFTPLPVIRGMHKWPISVVLVYRWQTLSKVLSREQTTSALFLAGHIMAFVNIFSGIS